MSIGIVPQDLLACNFFVLPQLAADAQALPNPFLTGIKVFNTRTCEVDQTDQADIMDVKDFYTQSKVIAKDFYTNPDTEFDITTYVWRKWTYQSAYIPPHQMVVCVATVTIDNVLNLKSMISYNTLLSLCTSLNSDIIPGNTLWVRRIANNSVFTSNMNSCDAFMFETQTFMDVILSMCLQNQSVYMGQVNLRDTYAPGSETCDSIVTSLCKSSRAYQEGSSLVDVCRCLVQQDQLDANFQALPIKANALCLGEDAVSLDRSKACAFSAAYKTQDIRAHGCSFVQCSTNFAQNRMSELTCDANSNPLFEIQSWSYKSNSQHTPNTSKADATPTSSPQAQYVLQHPWWSIFLFIFSFASLLLFIIVSCFL